MSIAWSPILMLALIGSILVAGIALIVIGFRGRALWSSPYCVACKYDLRGRVPEDSPNCPECGADLSHPKAVGFLRQGRRPWLIGLGVCVLISPFILAAGAALITYIFTSSSSHIGPSNLSQQTNIAVLTYVQNHIDEPWGWDELTRRIRAGSLSASESDQALQDLTNYMVTQSPGGWNRPMSWQGEFLKEGYQAGLFTDAAVLDFADAYFGKNPKPDALPRAVTGQTESYVSFTFGSDWEMPQHGGLPLELLWAIDEVTIDRKPVVFRGNTNDNRGLAEITISGVSPDDHELVVTLDAAYIESRHLIGFNRHNASPDDWPQAVRRWPVTFKQTLTVLGDQDHPVKLSTDPALAPGADGVTVQYIVVQPERGRYRVSLDLDVKNSENCALSYDVAIDLAGDRHALGSMRCIGGYLRASKHTILLDELDPSITTADVILTPNPRHVYHLSEVDAVWGEPIIIEDVLVKRYDLRDPDEVGDSN